MRRLRWRDAGAGQADRALRRQSDFARWADGAEFYRGRAEALRGLPLACAAGEDGNDLAGIEAAIEAAKAETGKPSLIAVRTVIGYGSPKAGTTRCTAKRWARRPWRRRRSFSDFPKTRASMCPTMRWPTGARRGARRGSGRGSGRSFSRSIARISRAGGGV
jgi:hypothetical protein